MVEPSDGQEFPAAVEEVAADVEERCQDDDGLDEREVDQQIDEDASGRNPEEPGKSVADSRRLDWPNMVSWLGESRGFSSVETEIRR